MVESSSKTRLPSPITNLHVKHDIWGNSREVVEEEEEDEEEEDLGASPFMTEMWVSARWTSTRCILTGWGKMKLMEKV